MNELVVEDVTRVEEGIVERSGVTSVEGLDLVT